MTSTALLVMDVQQGIVDRHAGDVEYLPRLAGAIGTARGAGVRIIYVVVGFRAGYPEVSQRNKGFAAISGTGRMTDGDPGAAIPPAIGPAPGDIVVTKRRVSAFAGSDLEVVLRAGGHRTAWCWRASPPAAWCCRPCARPLTWTTASPSWPTAAWTPTPRCTGS